MNSVVASWLRPWEFVSRASGWTCEIDVLAGDGKLKTTLGRVEGEGVGDRRAEMSVGHIGAYWWKLQGRGR